MGKDYKKPTDNKIEEMQEPSQMYGEVFRFANCGDSKILVGAFREEKKQLEWIMGERPFRYEKLYNVRVNEDLFSVRDGGVTTDEQPEYVLIYDYKNVGGDYHLPAGSYRMPRSYRLRYP